MAPYKVLSVCFKWDLETLSKGGVKWIIYNDRDKATLKQKTEELQEPTMLQHFNIVGENDDGFILELQDGLEVDIVEVSNGKNV